MSDMPNKALYGLDLSIATVIPAIESGEGRA